MGDLVKRPRGGWQVGTHLFGRNRQSLYNEQNPDPAPDVFAVKRLPDGQFIVSHYPTAAAEKPCCRPVQVRPRAGEDEVATLARADQMIAEQHAEKRKRGAA